MRGLLVTLKFMATIDPLGLRSALIRLKTGPCQVMLRLWFFTFTGDSGSREPRVSAWLGTSHCAGQLENTSLAPAVDWRWASKGLPALSVS